MEKNKSLSVNEKLLFMSLDLLEKLQLGEISIDEAKANAMLLKQANNALRYELDVERLNLRVKLIGSQIPSEQVVLKQTIQLVD
jgi:hypothetical protein